MSRTIEKRLAAVERRLLSSKPALHEIYVEGGLVEGIYRQANIGGGSVVVPEPGEDLPQFQQRVRALAQSMGATFVVYGGLPDNPVEWTTPPGMDEALARAGWSKADEIDE